MADYSTDIIVKAPADAVFRFISDVQNMPKYLPTVSAAQKQSADRVAVEGDANGHHYKSDGWFKVDEAGRAVRWGSDGENDYHGEMRVADADGGARIDCRVHLNAKPEIREPMEQHQGGQGPAMKDGLEAALRSIKQICEGTGGKEKSSAER